MTARARSEPGCDKRHFGRGLCQMHLARLYKAGAPLPPVNRREFTPGEDERILALPTNKNGKILHKALEGLALVLGRHKTTVGNRRRLLLSRR